ncbi:MAG: cobyrinate a,c-diamide synthase [Treponema sp.]|nr:cobyrinate a,c-diamide synthase [Treponema sp.]
MKSQIFNAPRVMIASPKSGSGKTTLTCALLQTLKNQGKNPIAFKCGPDFIDPMFHRNVLGIDSTNLDSFFCSEEKVLQIFADNFFLGSQKGKACAVIEGVMGLYDGLGGISMQASSYDVAKITKTPIILTVDVLGMSRSVLPLIKGFLDYDEAKLIKGVFLNNTNESQFLILKKLIKEEFNIEVLGFFPKLQEYVWKSRHLGLFLPDEIHDLKEQVDRISGLLEKNMDFSALDKIFSSSTQADLQQGIFFPVPNIQKKNPPSVKVAVAHDETFCFYYRENLRLLEDAGAQLLYFSPLHDKSIPEGVQGILLGGGYPELYGKQLQENTSMRKSIREAAENGVAVMAECGGFMYLQENMTDTNGSTYEMCGVLEGKCSYTGHLVRFGYCEFSPKYPQKGIFSPLRGHEFHYFDSTENGDAFNATKKFSAKSWDCGIFTDKILAGFPHFYYHSNPEIVKWFIEACKSV